MPRRDGTGPESLGPGTGRRRGPCFGVLYNKKGHISIWRSLILPAVGFIINDARKPDGITKRAIHSISDHFRDRRKKLEDKKKIEIQDEEYKIIE
ncbi:MAG: DUF5320 domain-containing protein [Candidatus Cloacimonetes bacterium]|nr:DUF5320 domain-containing protein [Candidatus Cloacimonadota bacterium]